MYTVEQQLQAQLIPFENLNFGLINLYIQWYREGIQKLSPSKLELVKAAIALQEAYAKKDYCEVSEVSQWPTSDAEMLDKAIASFKNGMPHPIHNAVRKEYLPRSKAEGDNVLIHCFFLNTRAVIEGKIANIISYPLGKGYVIDVTKLIDHYLCNGPRSKYMALWVSNDPTAMSGFISH
jgi:hypothetical protein